LGRLAPIRPVSRAASDTFIGATAEFERELIRERFKAGMKNARAKRITSANVDAAQIARLHAQALSWKKIAKQTGLGVGTLYRFAPANKPTC
jgi:DNA invertase Pin-like site-specific DNA recombinase